MTLYLCYLTTGVSPLSLHEEGLLPCDLCYVNIPHLAFILLFMTSYIQDSSYIICFCLLYVCVCTGTHITDNVRGRLFSKRQRERRKKVERV